MSDSVFDSRRWWLDPSKQRMRCTETTREGARCKSIAKRPGGKCKLHAVPVVKPEPAPESQPAPEPQSKAWWLRPENEHYRCNGTTRRGERCARQAVRPEPLCSGCLRTAGRNPPPKEKREPADTSTGTALPPGYPFGLMTVVELIGRDKYRVQCRCGAIEVRGLRNIRDARYSGRKSSCKACLRRTQHKNHEVATVMQLGEKFERGL